MNVFIFTVEQKSKQLINDTLNFNHSFQMDFNEKYSKCDSIKHIESTGKFQCNK